MHDDVKRDNRKALPKFLLILLGSAVFGGVLGFLTGWMGYSAGDFAAEAADAFIGRVIPWLVPAVCLALLLAALWQYRRAKGLFAAWDGDAEEPIDRAEDRLNWVLLLSAVALVLDFFLLSASPYSQLPFGALTGVAVFLLIAAAVTLLQQRAVDLTRRMNPEKRGSVYDMHFQKKWLESCDEAERAQIGQASYRAYRVTGMACLVLWVVLIVLDFSFGIGILPSFVVLLLWGILQASYILECIRLGKRKR